jgi:hypothetical protein
LQAPIAFKDVKNIKDATKWERRADGECHHVEREMLTKEALEKTAKGSSWRASSVDFNDPAYDFDYIGFTIEPSPKGKYDMA